MACTKWEWDTCGAGYCPVPSPAWNHTSYRLLPLHLACGTLDRCTYILWPDILTYRPPFVQTWHTVSWLLHHMFQFFCTKSLNLCENSTLVSHSTRLKLAQPMNLHTRSASRNTGHEKSAAIKAQTCWVATEQTIRKARGDFHLQSFRSDRGEGKGEVFPGGRAINQTPLNHSIWEICLGGVPASCWGEFPVSPGDS